VLWASNTSAGLPVLHGGKCLLHLGIALGRAQFAAQALVPPRPGGPARPGSWSWYRPLWPMRRSWQPTQVASRRSCCAQSISGNISRLYSTPEFLWRENAMVVFLLVKSDHAVQGQRRQKQQADGQRLPHKPQIAHEAHAGCPQEEPRGIAVQRHALRRDGPRATCCALGVAMSNNLLMLIDRLYQIGTTRQPRRDQLPEMRLELANACHDHTRCSGACLDLRSST